MTDNIEVVVLSDSESPNTTPPPNSPPPSSYFPRLFDDTVDTVIPLHPSPRPVCRPSSPKRRKLPPDLDPVAQRSIDACSIDPVTPPAVPSSSQSRTSVDSKKATAQTKKAAAEARREERERKRAEKAAAVEARRKERVRQKIADHASSGACRRSEVELVVSRQLVEQRRKKMDVLKDVRSLFPSQIVASDERIPNLISWRRKPGVGSREVKMEHGSDANVTLVVFSGKEYLDGYRGMHDYAKTVLNEKVGQRVIFVVWGVVQECKTRMSRQLREGSGGEIIGLQGLQDGYTHLYVEFGIRTHVCANQNEVAAYVVQMTDAVASVPYHRAAGFLDASIKYRDMRRTLRHQTTVLAMHSAPDSQMEEDAEDEEGEEVEDSFREGTEGESFAGSSSVGVPFVRTEGSGDLGHMYLAMLCMIPGVSAAKARAIRLQYATLVHLLKAYEDCPSQELRKGLLKDLRYGQNSRRIGPALSAVIANVLSNTTKFSAIQT